MLLRIEIWLGRRRYRVNRLPRSLGCISRNSSNAANSSRRSHGFAPGEKESDDEDEPLGPLLSLAKMQILTPTPNSTPACFPVCLAFRCAWHQIRNVPGKDGAPGHGSGVGPN